MGTGLITFFIVLSGIAVLGLLLMFIYPETTIRLIVRAFYGLFRGIRYLVLFVSGKTRNHKKG